MLCLPDVSVFANPPERSNLHGRPVAPGLLRPGRAYQPQGKQQVEENKVSVGEDLAKSPDSGENGRKSAHYLPGETHDAFVSVLPDGRDSKEVVVDNQICEFV